MPDKIPDVDVRQIVKSYLIANGFEGLYSDDCGCQISDLFPCDECMFQCKPGYKVAAHENDPEGFDFYIMSSKGEIKDYMEGFE